MILIYKRERLQVRFKISKMSITCQRNGCTKDYVEEENTETSCQYHPGAPIFHEGLKGYYWIVFLVDFFFTHSKCTFSWSCCKKRVINFDDFLTIPVIKY
jgi:hypothetical protein